MYSNPPQVDMKYNGLTVAGSPIVLQAKNPATGKVKTNGMTKLLAHQLNGFTQQMARNSSDSTQLMAHQKNG